MQEIAEEAGNSLIVPTFCWYCGQRIYLYAAPNGGFAIFDKLGIPWPKHNCSGVNPDNPKYHVQIQSYKKDYNLLIPTNTEIVYSPEAAEISGVVIKISTSNHTMQVERRIEIYTGSVIVTARIRNDGPRVGDYINGQFSFINGKYWLTQWEEVRVPENLSGIQPEYSKKLPPEEKSFKKKLEEIYESMKQSGAFESGAGKEALPKKKSENSFYSSPIRNAPSQENQTDQNRKPDIEELLEMSLMQEKYLSAVFLILAFFGHVPSNQMDEKKFSHYSALLLAIIDDLDIQRAFFNESHRVLTKKVREYLRGHSREEYETVKEISMLKSRFESLKIIQARFGSLLKKEKPFLSNIEDIIPQVKELRENIMMGLHLW